MRRRAQATRWLVLAVVVTALAGACTTPPVPPGGDGGSTTTSSPSPSSTSSTTSTSTTTTAVAGTPRYEVRIHSEPGDFIGGGRDNSWTARPPSAFLVRSDGNGVTVRFDPGFGSAWSFGFSAPEGDTLTEGPYESAESYYFGSPTRPGISVSGNGLACNNSPTGRFDVLKLQLGPNGVEQFAATFTHQCAGSSGKLTGEIYFGAAAPFPTPQDSDGDGVADTIDNCRATRNPTQADADLDRSGDLCDATFTHTSVTFASEPGDFIGEGAHQSWYGVDGTFSAQPLLNRPGSVEVRFDGGQRYWNLTFISPDGAPLMPGSYPNSIKAIPTPAPGVPGLWVIGSGRACNEITGGFVVHEVVRDPSGVIQRFSADFVQYCDGSSAALRGSVRYDASQA